MQMKDKQIINKISQNQLILSLYLTQLLNIIIAILLSLFLFSNTQSFLDLFVIEMKWIVIAVIFSLIIVGFDWTMWRLLPPSYYDDGGINKKLFTGLPVYKVAVISLIVAVCEEILFRGVLQTHIGLVLTSVIFALVHVRYLKKWFLFVNVVLLSFGIGFLYELSNHQLIPVIILHFFIDFLLGIIIAKQLISD